MAKKYTPEELKLIKQSLEQDKDVWSIVDLLKEKGFDHSVDAVKTCTRRLWPRPKMRKEVRRLHPIMELANTLGVRNTCDLGYAYGHELDLGYVPGLRDERCLSCGDKLERGTVAFAVYKMRYSQGFQCGRWHQRCIREGIAAAPTRKGFCWLTGAKNVPVKFMSTTAAQRFSATEEALLEWVAEYEKCHTPEERAETRYRLRSKQVVHICNYRIEKSHSLRATNDLCISRVCFGPKSVNFTTGILSEVSLVYNNIVGSVSFLDPTLAFKGWARRAFLEHIIMEGNIHLKEFWQYIKATHAGNGAGPRFLNRLCKASAVRVTKDVEPLFHIEDDTQPLGYRGVSASLLKMALDEQSRHDALGYAEFHQHWPIVKLVIQHIEKLPVLKDVKVA